MNNIDPRTNDYRPTKNIFQTFIKESDNLIKLEDFALRRANYDTNINIIKRICSNIVFIQKKVIEGHFFQIDCAAASNWDTSKTVGWRRAGLTYSAKDIRKKEIDKYEQMQKLFPEELKKQRMQKYLEVHTEEKKQLDDIEKQIRDIENKNAPKINELTKERDKKLSAEVEVDKQTDAIRDLENQRSKCGIFQIKEKKAITERIDTVERTKLEKLKQQAEKEKKLHIERINQQIKAVQSEEKELRDEADRLKEPINEFVAEIEKEI